MVVDEHHLSVWTLFRKAKVSQISKRQADVNALHGELAGGEKKINWVAPVDATNEKIRREDAQR